MKRRVVRGHGNKKNLRLLSSIFYFNANNNNKVVPHGGHADGSAADAADGVPPTVYEKGYHILLDSSFLKAFLLSFQKEYKNILNAYKQHYTGSSRRTPTQPPDGISSFSYLKEIVADVFAVMDGGSHKHHPHRHPSSRPPAHDDDDDAYYFAPTHHHTKLFFYYIPQTEQQLLKFAASFQAERPRKQRQKDAFSLTPAAVTALLAPFKRLPLTAGGSASAAASSPWAERNEVNALALFYNAHLHRLRDPAPPAAPAVFYFLGTQNHDLRKALHPSSALLRLCHAPLAVVVEHLASTYHYEAEGRPPSPAAAPAVALSEADKAFMRYLHVTPPTGAAARPPQRPRPPHTEKSPAPAPAARGRKKKAVKAAPNPLAMKKKQKREVFRI
ncbi:hypothetical protein STCU_10982 [Strigomonas culicis]|uniref:Uncharacterized protein n=1 Tax=Strigomonas culicis TaxID=28005 RepID=S9UQ81_9TRYP|nr:hypothetical protein STCU_10982 [Strigomonas culicis]|eukprot:EPY16801.1 hypothetical protein STCU_10982 [Strigomonas culicis]